MLHIKNYNVINNKSPTEKHTRVKLSCHSQNLIYLLTCSSCNLQYVGETTQPLHKRINIHRTAKSGCEHMINHYKDVCAGAHFTIQILECFPGTGYVDGKPCSDSRKIRLDREEYWIENHLPLWSQ